MNLDDDNGTGEQCSDGKCYVILIIYTVTKCKKYKFGSKSLERTALLCTLEIYVVGLKLWKLLSHPSYKKIDIKGSVEITRKIQKTSNPA